MKLKNLAHAALVLAALGSPVAAKDALTLRVNDAIAEPGGLAAVVIRTYASRPAGQGQICIITRSGRAGAGGGPFAELVDYRVFSKKGDAVSAAAMETEGGEQIILIEFSSKSATINRRDGPLAVLFFRLRDDLRPGRSFAIELDLDQTRLVGRNGESIRLEPRGGELEVRRPGSPYLAEAEDDKIEPGERAEIGMGTFEPVGMAEGRIGLRFDPDLVAGKIRVKMKKQHGKRRFRADRSEPGLVLVTFKSKNASLNSVPGELLAVDFKTPAGVRVGTRSRVWLDPSLTFFVDAEGGVLPFKFEDGTLEFEAD